MRAIGPFRALWASVISPSSLTELGWSPASFLNVTANLGTATGASDSSATGDTGESFQNIFTQATGAQSSSDGAAQNTSADPSWTAVSSSGVPYQTPASLNAPAESNKSTVAGSNTTPHANTKTATKSAAMHGSKTEPVHRWQAGNSGKAQLQTSSKESADQDESLNSQTLPGVSSKINPPKDQSASAGQTTLPAAAVNALGGAKALPGAAFAMHITPNTNQSANPSASDAVNSAVSSVDSDAASLGDVAAFGSNLIAAVASAQAQVGGGENLNNTALTTSAVAWSSTANSPAADSTSTASAPVSITSEVAEMDETDPSAAPQTVRSVQVQLTDQDTGRVDLRLVEHAGGLSVSVRSTDSNLTKGLQENLPELSARLEAEKYQAHTFVPAASETSSGGSASEQPSSQNHESNSQSFSGGGGSSSGGDAGGRQSNGQNGDSSQNQSDAWSRQWAALQKSSSSYAAVSLPADSVEAGTNQ